MRAFLFDYRFFKTLHSSSRVYFHRLAGFVSLRSAICLWLDCPFLPRAVCQRFSFMGQLFFYCLTSCVLFFSAGCLPYFLYGLSAWSLSVCGLSVAGCSTVSQHVTLSTAASLAGSTLASSFIRWCCVLRSAGLPRDPVCWCPSDCRLPTVGCSIRS